MARNLEDLIDSAELQAMLGLRATSIHDKGRTGEVTEPVKVSLRAARWPYYEALAMQKALLAGCGKGQRKSIAAYLTDARKSTNAAAESIYARGLTMIAEFVEANAKAEAA
jgi:hypothetical protein